MKRIVWYTTVILLTLVGLFIAWQFRVAFVLFFLSLATASVFRPPIDFLIRHKVPRILAILLTYITGIGIVVGLISLAGAPLINELQQASNDFTVLYTHIKTTWVIGSQFQQTIAAQLPPLQDLSNAIAGQQAPSLLQAILGFASNIFDVASHGVIVLVLSAYWNADNEHFERLWLSVLPAQYRSHARDIWRDIEKGVGAYIRSEIIQSLLAAVLLGYAYGMMGLRYPTLLAILGALAWLIPWLGAVLAIIPPLLVGLWISPQLGLAAALVTLVVLIVMEVIIEPRFFNRRRYSSLLVVVMVVALSDAFGLVGLILAPPLAAAIQIFFSHYLEQPSTTESVVTDIQIDTLRDQLSHVQEMARSMDQSSPQVISLMQRLESLINQADAAVRSERLAESE